MTGRRSDIRKFPGNNCVYYNQAASEAAAVAAAQRVRTEDLWVLAGCGWMDGGGGAVNLNLQDRGRI